MKKNIKKLLVLALTLIMMLSLAVPAFASAAPYTFVLNGSGKNVNYVAFGDSATNGYGLQDYPGHGIGRDSTCPETYPVRFAQYLNSKGYSVNFSNLSMTGMRTNDLVFLLDPSVEREDLDAFGKDRWGEYMGAYASADEARERYINATKEADVITYALGVNNLANYMVARVGELFGISLGFSWGYQGDSFNDLMANNDINISIAFRNNVTKLVEAATQGVVSEDIIAGITEAFLYSYANFVIGFRDCMDLIYEYNPDVELIVLSLDNNMAGMTISYGDAIIDLGVLWDGLLRIANTYIMDLNPHNSQYKYVDISSGIENIMQAVAAREEIYPNLADDIFKLFYSDNMFGAADAAKFIGDLAGTDPVSLSTAKAVYRQQDGSAVCQAVNYIMEVFVKAAKYTEPVDFQEGLPIFMDGGVAAFKPYLIESFTDFDNASPLAKSVTHLMYYLLDSSAAAHPSGYGHEQKLNALIKVYECCIAANGTHLVNIVKGTKTLVNDTVKVLKSTDPVQAIRSSVKSSIKSVLPIRFGK